MISLRELFLTAYPEWDSLAELPEIPIHGLECDSRKVEKGFLFIALQGLKEDGHLFISQALNRGASAVVGEKKASLPVPFIQVPEGRLAMARLARAFYRDPAKAMICVGITGTNGKTTSSYLIEHLLKEDHKKVGVLGTINYRFGENEIPAVETTPGALRMQQILAQMREADCQIAVMEVSSHALEQRRVEGIIFHTALFTNLTQDHLDYHKTMEAYFACKSRLFENLNRNQIAVLNMDDDWVRQLRERLSCRILTYGEKTQEVDFKAERVQGFIDRTQFELIYRGKKIQVDLPLIGRHNVSNALGALAVAYSLGIQPEQACRSLSSFKGVPGRLEALETQQNFSLFIDFAHTPDGLKKALTTLASLKKRKLLVVFGCGGDRDRKKRPLMANIASQFCDFVLVTSDNPRSEDPREIAKDICAGFPKTFTNFAVELDRRKAIRQALLLACPEDIVLLAGKGHERSQVIGDRALPFNEREEAQRVLDGH